MTWFVLIKPPPPVLIDHSQLRPTSHIMDAWGTDTITQDTDGSQQYTERDTDTPSPRSSIRSWESTTWVNCYYYITKKIKGGSFVTNNWLCVVCWLHLCDGWVNDASGRDSIVPRHCRISWRSVSFFSFFFIPLSLSLRDFDWSLPWFHFVHPPSYPLGLIMIFLSVRPGDPYPLSPSNTSIKQ